MRETAGKIVLSFLDKYPNMPSLTLAKLIFEKHPLEWNNIDAIRSSIRSYRGRNGESQREKYKNNKHFKPLSQGIDFSPYSLPTEESEDFKPYVLKRFNVGIISDLHIPNHRNEPIRIAITYFKKQKVDAIIINGDLLDNTPFTKHDGKRPSAKDVKRWFDMAEYFLENLREEFPNAEILWLEGNHDFWYKRWMYSHAWQLGEDEYYSLQERLHLHEYKVRYIEQTQYVMLGKLAVSHGHQLSGKWGAGVSPARSVYLKTKQPMIIGHVHVTDDYTDNDLHKVIATCWTTGCLCTLTPEYQPMGGKACHGFAHVLVDKDGDFTVTNKRIYKGKVL